MGIFSAINRVERGFAWGFTGVLLAVIFGALAVYTEFFRKSTPVVEFELVGNTSVLDVREKLPDLEVMYQQRDIAKLGQTLSVLLVRVTNQGNAVLLGNHYDNRFPLALALSGGTLIRSEVSGASNEYLKQAARVHMREKAIVEMEPVILEPGEWYIVKLLALHGVGSQPSVSATGKIAGTQSIRVVPLLTPADGDSVWSRAFAGDVWAQIVRVVAYGAGGVIILIISIAAMIGVNEAYDKWKRKRLVRRFKAGRSKPVDEKDECIFEEYISAGASIVIAWSRLAADPGRLDWAAKELIKVRETRAAARKRARRSEMEMRMVARFHGGSTVSELMRLEIATKVDGKWLIEEARRQLMIDFADFLLAYDSELRGNNKVIMEAEMAELGDELIENAEEMVVGEAATVTKTPLAKRAE